MEGQVGKLFTWQKLIQALVRSEAIPWANFLAVIAAKDAIAYKWPQLRINTAFVLDSEIGNAP